MASAKGFNFLGEKGVNFMSKLSGVKVLSCLFSSVLFITLFFVLPSMILASINTSSLYSLSVSFGEGKGIIATMWSSWAGLAAILTPVVFLIFLIGAITGDGKKKELNKRRVAAIFFMVAVIVYVFLRTLFVLNDSDWEWTGYMFFSAWSTYCSIIGIPVLLFFCSSLIYSTKKKTEKSQ